MKAENCIAIFNQAICIYHEKDDVDQNWHNPYKETSTEAVMFTKCWIDTVQWHLEDIVRNPNIDPNEGMAIKRRIDASNQHRTDTVELIDDYYIALFNHAPTNSQATLNTESPAWVVDRLSILCLKIYHMQEQVTRQDVDEAHIAKCQSKLSILLEQQQDLTVSFNTLLDEMAHGLKKIKVYRQMKMYNDNKLNPVLYKK